MKRFFLFFALLLLAGLDAFANDIQFTANAPNAVINGRRFNLVFSLKNAQPENLQIPDLSNFEVIMGPSVSQGTEMQIINGTVNRSESVSYTYVLQPKKEGTFTISPAKITANGKTVMTNALTIKVLPEDQAGNAASSGNNGNNSATVAEDDIFIKTDFTKKKVFEQEHIVSTIKLYYRVNVRGLEEVKLPEYKGFSVQEITIPEDKKYGMETLNGKNYKTAILKQAVLFPQKSGTIEIESGKVSTIIQIQVNNQRSRNIFDDFFGSYRDVKKTLTISGTKIEVSPLPDDSKPANFSNAVGTFKMESSINSESVKTNEAINIKLKISGNGNIRFIKNPEIKFPSDFEVYDPKVDTKTSVSTAGVSGTREIEYLAIPRFAGEFTIPAAQFVYFDTRAKQYKTLSTPEFQVKVEKGEGSSSSPQVVNYANKEDIKSLGEDIRFIDTKNLKINEKDDYLFGTAAFGLSYITPFALFVILFILYRKQAKENANVALMKNKKANKQAKKRLKVAETYLKAGNKSAFYEEILKALWGYTSDKLNIPVAELTKDNIEAELAAYKVSQETINQFMELLQMYEFARFAPIESVGTMDDSYEKAIELIGKLEEEVRK